MIVLDEAVHTAAAAAEALAESGRVTVYVVGMTVSFDHDGLRSGSVQWDPAPPAPAPGGVAARPGATFQTDQSFGTLAARMVERGLIERVPASGRAIRHRITDKGEAVRSEGDRRVSTVVERSLAGLSPHQLDQLGALLEHVLQEPLDREPAGIGS